MVTIRPAGREDLIYIAEIYNEAVKNSNATFDTEPRAGKKLLAWFDAHGENHPVIVAESEKKITGWASLSRWSDKKAYDTTAEVSVYVHKNFRSRGIGKKLIEIITLEGKKRGLHNLLARISEGNEVSIHLFETFGYEHFGTMKEAGKKFGRFWDVHLLQKIISEG